MIYTMVLRILSALMLLIGAAGVVFTDSAVRQTVAMVAFIGGLAVLALLHVAGKLLDALAEVRATLQAIELNTMGWKNTSGSDEDGNQSSL